MQTESEFQIMSEFSKIGVVAQWKLIRDRNQISQENQRLARYYGKVILSKEKCPETQYIEIRLISNKCCDLPVGHFFIHTKFL